MRQNRALEWVEMIRDNPKIFVEDILCTESFQDGFVYMLDAYIRERNEEKRLIIKKIFLGFAQANNKNEFELERFTHTLSQLNFKDFIVIRDIEPIRFDPSGADAIRDKVDDRNYQIYGDSDINIESIHNLINLGILHDHTANRVGPIQGPYVSVSEFGKKFFQYIIS